MKIKRKYLKLKYAMIGLIFSGIIEAVSLLILGAEINEDFNIKILIIKLISLLLIILSNYMMLYILDNTKELKKIQA